MLKLSVFMGPLFFFIFSFLCSSQELKTTESLAEES